MNGSRMFRMALAVALGATLVETIAGCAPTQERGLEAQGLAPALAAQGCSATELLYFENGDGVAPQDPLDNRAAPIAFAVGLCPTNEFLIAYSDPDGNIQTAPAQWHTIRNEQGNLQMTLTAPIGDQETAIAVVRFSRPLGESEIATADAASVAGWQAVDPANPDEGITVADPSSDPSTAALMAQMVRQAVSTTPESTDNPDPNSTTSNPNPNPNPNPGAARNRCRSQWRRPG